MKQIAFFIFGLIASATGAHAACYADYKAKQDNPLRLHYGVIELTGECSVQTAETELPDRLSGDGWTLLSVMGVFDDAGLEERKDSAGDFFLRY
jgi:hypothetical protein